MSKLQQLQVFLTMFLLRPASSSLDLGHQVTIPNVGPHTKPFTIDWTSKVFDSALRKIPLKYN